MSSADVRLAVPRSGDDHSLVYPDASSSSSKARAAQEPAAADSNKSGGSNAASASAAFSRAFAGMLAFMFKRPIRLFRPVKISTMAGIQAIAEEQGRTVTPAFVRALIRKEGWRFFPKHVLPPLTINALIGLTLFTTYTTSESLLHARLESPAAVYVLVPFVSGAFAGAAQSIISAPLDNARHLLLRRQRFLRQAAEIPRASRRKRIRSAAGGSAGLPFTSWWTLLRDSVFRVGSVTPTDLSAELPAVVAKLSGRERLDRARRWARRGWSFFTLSVTKDSIAFGVFFVVFECGREGARRLGLAWDGIALPSLSTYDEREGGSPGHDKQRRSASGLILQSVGILVSGGVAGWIFSLVARPFERIRAAIYEGRAKWAEQQSQPAREPRRHRNPTSNNAKSHLRERSQRARSAGGASERRNWAKLGDSGRKSFAVRIGHVRNVARRIAPIRPRRRGAPTLGVEPESDRPGRTAPQFPEGRPAVSISNVTQNHDGTRLKAKAALQPVPTPPATMPGAVALVRNACHQYGTTRFLFGPRSALQALDARRQRASILPSATGKPASAPPKRPTPGPTRLSARGKQSHAPPSAGSRLLRAGTTVIRYVPPYAVGFFAYAIVSGDLKIEV
ncbi:hypothetical protein JCM3774_002773 [Rhodotorula dairenensis]